MNEALEKLELAAELEPEVTDFSQARDLLKEKIDSERITTPEVSGQEDDSR